MRVARPINLTPEERSILEQHSRARSLPARIVERARIVLRAASGLENQQIAEELGITPEKAARWRNRFLDGGFAGLEKDAPRPGGPRTITDKQIGQVVAKTTQEKPSNSTHWSTRTMAAAVGMSEASIRRIWHAHGLKPHLVRTFKLSNDPQFSEKLEAIVGLYLNPPDHALVLCADEKSQLQALDRTQPGLPLKKGRCGTMTHDYKRNGTATLFAALNTFDGTVISMCDDRHRHQEWLRFLRVIDEVTPSDKTLHLIVDNYATHKHPKVQRWLARHPRFHIHFTPTSSSWLNMVERFFRDLTENGLRRGIFRDVEELIMAIGAYIDKHNDQPKPFIWTAKAADILEKVKRARKSLDNRHSASRTTLDSDWEGEFCRVAESHPSVKAYVKNHNLGLEVPYRHASEPRRYLPDLVVLVDDGHGSDDLLHLIVEIKGYRREDAKEKKTTMDTYWVPGVNNNGEYGRWAFAEFRDVYQIEADFKAKVESEFNKMIESVSARTAVAGR